MYFDNNATTTVHRKFINGIVNNMTECYGNASCAHSMGVSAAYELEKARAKVAVNLGTSPENIIFTSGASESVSMVLSRFDKEDIDIVTTDIEHDCVVNSAKDRCVTIPLNDGKLDICQVQQYLNYDECYYGKRKHGFSFIYVSNETGNIIIEDIQRVVNLIKEAHPDNFIHLDMTQALGKLPINLDEMGIDAASFSGHKIHAPKGVGALYFKNRDNLEIQPIINGGGQEFGLRGGTENIPSIVAFSEAVEYVCATRDTFVKAAVKFREYMLEALSGITRSSSLDCTIFTKMNNSVCNTLFFGYTHKGNVDVKELVDYLSDRDVYVSTGSACNNNKPGYSNTVRSLGLENSIGPNCIRISSSRFNTMGEVAETMDIFKSYFAERA